MSPICTLMDTALTKCPQTPIQALFIPHLLTDNSPFYMNYSSYYPSIIVILVANVCASLSDCLGMFASSLASDLSEQLMANPSTVHTLLMQSQIGNRLAVFM